MEGVGAVDLYGEELPFIKVKRMNGSLPEAAGAEAVAILDPDSAEKRYAQWSGRALITVGRATNHEPSKDHPEASIEVADLGATRGRR